MTQSEFTTHLHAATAATLAFSRQLCWNRIPEAVNYLIQPDNLNEQAHYLNELEMRCFLARKRELGQRLTAAEVVDRLWVNGQVPAWINISAYYTGWRVTTIELLIDRRLGADAAAIYHQREGFPPFHLAVPTPTYAHNAQGQLTDRFHSNWQHWPWRLWLELGRGWYRLRKWH